MKGRFIVRKGEGRKIDGEAEETEKGRWMERTYDIR